VSLLCDILVVASVLAGSSGLADRILEDCAGECSLWRNQGTRGGWFALSAWYPELLGPGAKVIWNQGCRTGGVGWGARDSRAW